MSLSDFPCGPACPSRESGCRSRSAPHGISRVAFDFRLHACRRHYPGGIVGWYRSSRPTTASFATGPVARLPQCTVSRLAQRSLTFRPACSLNHQSDPLSSEYFSGSVTSATAPTASDWSDQLSGGTFTHGKSPPYHGIRPHVARNNSIVFLRAPLCSRTFFAPMPPPRAQGDFRVP
jgi:hypothetical protein